jgi:hypothetical protein
MIVTRLLGGLGNQLFQYAAGRRLAHVHGTELGLEISGFASGYELRRYELGAFALEGRVISLPELEAWATDSTRGQRPMAYLKEPHFHFWPSLLAAPADAFLEGYWQSERYFADIAPLLRQELSLAAPLGAGNQRLLDDIHQGGGPAISLHVRRADYVNNPRTNAVHGTCDLDYYQRGIAHLLARVPGARFFVFSDDPAWADAHLVPLIPAPARLVTGNDGRGHLDLTLMRHCHHHLIANSTFSWWGAWLGEAPDKQVVAPARWFAASHLDARDLIPAAWTRL